MHDGSPYTNSKSVRLDSTANSIVVSKSTNFKETVYLKGTTLGGVSKTKQINLLVCGGEEI
jgi:hypothetical protein